MRTLISFLAIPILLSFPHADARAGEPKKQAEWLPIPQPAPRSETIVIPETPPPGSREFWQYYGVDGFGRFRPRVILSPFGAYDMRTGEPYPWITNRSTAFVPNVLGAPAGSIARPTTHGSAPFVVLAPAKFMPYAAD